MKYQLLFLLILLVVAISGCHTPQVTRGSEDSSVDDRALSTGIDMKDWRFAVVNLMRDMQSKSFYAQVRMGDKKTVAVSEFINNSANHIDTGFLREMVEEELINMGCFRLVEETKRGELLKTLTLQNEVTDLFDASTVAEKGRQLGVQFFVQGKVEGNRERGAEATRSQYLIVLEVVDVSTAEKVFKKTVPVSKLME